MLHEHTTYEVTCDLCGFGGGLFGTHREATEQWTAEGGSVSPQGDYCHGCEPGTT